MTVTPYHLEVKEGETVAETGHFFIAAPFDVVTANGTYTCTFTRGEDHHVRYYLTQNNAPVATLEHPDYTLDLSADQPEIKPLAAALLGLSITRDKALAQDLASQPLSYTVHQQPFLN